MEKNRDNILPRIMASSEGHTSLFERELSKYDGLKGAGLLVTLLPVEVGNQFMCCRGTL